MFVYYTPIVFQVYGVEGFEKHILIDIVDIYNSEASIEKIESEKQYLIILLVQGLKDS